MRYLLLILLFGGSLLPIQAQSGPLAPEDQEKLEAYEDTLQVLSVIMVTDSLEKNRFAAVRKMIPTLVEILKTPNSFRYPFEKLRSISIQYDPDSTFRIFTWQLYVDSENYRYYGAIQKNTTELSLFPLIDRSFEISSPVRADALSPEQWYGALYYKLMPLDHPDGPRYLLLGYDQYSLYRRRKVMDVLYFDGEGTPRFGDPIIPVAGDRKLSRLVLEYSAEAKVRLNYDPSLDLIVFDHLIQIDGRFGEGKVNVPDGSYQAFRIENGQLQFVDKVFEQVSAEPLMQDSTLLQGRRSERDLFGRKKGSGN